MADNHGYKVNVWPYDPSLAGNAIFIVIFFLFSGTHLIFCWRFHVKYFIPLLIGGIFEIIGYCFRVAAHKNLTYVGPYTAQTLLLLLAPILFAATCYMTLVRVIRSTHGEHFSLIRTKWLTRVFVTGDVVCFIIQAAGGGLQAGNTSQSLRNTGKWIVVAGLVLQLCIFGLYCLATVRFHRRLLAGPTSESLEPRLGWEHVIYVIYASSLLISARNVVRIVEYAQGFRGWVASHEVMLFVFDGMLMALLLLGLIVLYPPRLLRQGSSSPFSSTEEATVPSELK